MQRQRLSKRELTAVVKELIDLAYGSRDDNPRFWELRDVLDHNAAHPAPWEVIQGNQGNASTPEEIVDYIYEYQPIVLPPPAENT
jgi:hypothetical protein